MQMQHQINSIENKLQSALNDNRLIRNENEHYRQLLQQKQKQLSNQQIRSPPQHQLINNQTNFTSVLENAIARQTHELNFFMTENDDKSRIIGSLQEMLLDARRVIEKVGLEKEDLAMEKQMCEKHLDIFKRKVQELNKRLERVIMQKSQAKKQINELLINCNNLEKQKHQTLNNISQHLQRLLVNQNDQQESSQKLKQELNVEQERRLELEKIVNFQQMELADRNAEIQNMKAFGNSRSQSQDEKLVKNTIKHIRWELASKCELLKKVISQNDQAQEVISKYSQQLQENSQKMQQYDNLFNQKCSLESLLKQKTTKISQLQSQLRSANLAKNELKLNMIQVLDENQCYHYFLYRLYGQSYHEIINKERQNYERRLEERAKKERWSNVEELVEVNYKLMKRMKLV